jgi:hypothetical protein
MATSNLSTIPPFPAYIKSPCPENPTVGKIRVPTRAKHSYNLNIPYFISYHHVVSDFSTPVLPITSHLIQEVWNVHHHHTCSDNRFTEQEEP